MRSGLACGLFLLGLFLSVASASLAENELPSDGFISAGNAQQYRKLFPPEVLPLIRESALEIRAASALHYEWRMDDEWIKAGLEAQNGIGQDSAPSLKNPYATGFVFGPASSVKEDGDSRQRALRVLWNSQSVWWGARVIAGQFELAWTRSRQRWSTAWNLLRVYPSFFSGDEKKGNQLFRESVQAVQPKEIAGLALLSFRFMGSGEDGLWLYSPAIRKTRMLTGSNRADALLRSSVSLDDLLVWSGRPEMFEVSLSDTRELLMPMAGLESSQAIASGACAKIGDFQTSERAGVDSSAIGTENAQPLQLSSSTVFIPREAFVLQARSSDPFSAVGREVLYVDAASMLPLYREVYNPAGELWKVAVSSIGLATSADGKRKHIYPAETILFDRSSGERSLLKYRRMSFCQELPPGADLSLFDPRKLGPEDAPTPAPAQKKHSLPQPEAEPVDER